MKRFLPAIPGYAPIQRFEKQIPKMYYAPEWRLEKSGKRSENPENYSPMHNYGVNPEKWEYLNKVIWPPKHIVPETGKQKAKELFHCRETIHIHPKKIFNACEFSINMIVGDAIKQLRHKEIKPSLYLADVIEEASDRAKEEFKIENPLENMFVAEAFAVQDRIIKGMRRHAGSKWHYLRYRYINLFVRLQEGTPPPFKRREPDPSGWDKMLDYHDYLRSRDFKYSL